MYRINATDQLTVFVYVDNDTSSFFSFFLYFYERDARYRIALETRTTREIGRCYCAQIEPNSRLSFSRALLFFSFFFSFFFHFLSSYLSQLRLDPLSRSTGSLYPWRTRPIDELTN